MNDYEIQKIRDTAFCSGYNTAVSKYEKQNKELQKENAKLKADYEVLSCSVGDFDELQNKFEEEQRKNNGLSDNLTKAKEIIKKFSEFANNEVEYDPEHPQEHTDLWNKLCEEAEQFLSECK